MLEHFLLPRAGMPLAPSEASPGAAAPTSSRSHGAIAAMLVVVSVVVLVLGGVATVWRSAPDARDEAIARASHAVGVSAGVGFRGVVDVDLDAFRRGLLDGLASAPTDVGARSAEPEPMSRAERFALMRDVMKRLGDAEIAEVAARLDQGRDS